MVVSLMSVLICGQLYSNQRVTFLYQFLLQSFFSAEEKITPVFTYHVSTDFITVITSRNIASMRFIFKIKWSATYSYARRKRFPVTHILSLASK
jgi:hypothetical protein